MPEGRAAEVRSQGRQETARAGWTVTLPFVAAALAAFPTSLTSAADPAYIGRWILDRKFCKEVGDTAETMPLIIKARTMEWFVARGSYRTAAKRGDHWQIDARSSAEGETGPIPIVLQHKGDWLVVRWCHGKPAEMHRCP
jgi:hypothetical protein